MNCNKTSEVVCKKTWSFCNSRNWMELFRKVRFIGVFLRLGCKIVMVFAVNDLEKKNDYSATL